MASRLCGERGGDRVRDGECEAEGGSKEGRECGERVDDGDELIVGQGKALLGQKRKMDEGCDLCGDVPICDAHH